jgi:SAM-dependent methyltransferase
MTMAANEENTYFIDAESGAEMARLLDQDHLLNKAMGGVCVELENDFSGITSVLDVGCGPGGWVQEVAFANPEVEVVGIDISRTMIEYAQARARVQNLENASFEIANATQPLEFADASFDLINGRFLAGFLSTARWPQFLQECRRLLKPGGIIRITESELGNSTSEALERLQQLFIQALRQAGHGFLPHSRNYGISVVLCSLLRSAGFEQVSIKPHLIEYSFGTPAYEAFYKDWKVAYKLLQPFLVKMGVTTLEETEPLYQQMLIDMLSPDFCGTYDLYSAFGRRV